MSQQLTTISLEAIQYMCGLIRDLASVSEAIDNTNLADDKVFSNLYTKKLIDKCLEDANAESQKLVGALTHLTCEETTVQPTLDNSSINVIYLYSATGNAPYQQYLKISDTKLIDLGTTSVSLSGYLTATEIARDYITKLDFDALKTEVDKKLNKTDIIDNLTSTDTDKPLSANQGKVLKDEVDLKANDSDVVKKTDIVTTIDSASTDDKTPSAKAVFDNAIKDKNLNTYSDVTQLGLTTPITVGEIFNTLPNNSLLRVQNNNGTISDAPYVNGILIIDKVNQSKFSIEFKISAGGSIGDNGLYIGQLQGSDGSGLNWRRVCTSSSVKNVSWITISESTLTNTTFVPDGNCSYSIENGECFIRFNGLTTSSGAYITAPDETFPKPNVRITNGHYPLITSNGTAVMCIISSSGGLTIKVTSSIGDIYTTISYPVAES